MQRCREGKAQGMVSTGGLRERRWCSITGIGLQVWELHSHCTYRLSQPCPGVECLNLPQCCPWGEQVFYIMIDAIDWALRISALSSSVFSVLAWIIFPLGAEEILGHIGMSSSVVWRSHPQFAAGFGLASVSLEGTPQSGFWSQSTWARSLYVRP